MAATANHFILALLLFTSLDFTVGHVGVCFGRLGKNLPSPEKTVAMFKHHNIKRMRLYEPHLPTLRALAGTRIRLMLGVLHDDIRDLANCPQAATAWVQKYILSHPNVTFKYVTVGNEIEPESKLGPFVLPAMQNVYRALRDVGRAEIIVSTSITTDLLSKSYPPQVGEFKCSVNWYIRPILEFLRDTRAPILANVYPYFAYIGDPKNINLSYALLQPNSGVVAGGVYYDNLFYAIIDAVYAAIDRILGAAPPSTAADGDVYNMDLTVSESGHSSADVGAGEDAAGDGPLSTVENARIYNNNLMRVVKNGTPMRPGKPIETYIFAMYDENLKPGPEYERHFGIFLPNGKQKYPLRFY